MEYLKHTFQAEGQEPVIKYTEIDCSRAKAKKQLQSMGMSVVASITLCRDGKLCIIGSDGILNLEFVKEKEDGEGKCSDAVSEEAGNTAGAGERNSAAQ